MTTTQRCGWATQSELMCQYHDHEWGRPSTDNQKLFELLTLEIFQAGLSWQIILNRRPALREAFLDFDYYRVQELEPSDLLINSDIIRNRRKIEATIHNAAVFVLLDQKNQNFAQRLWAMVGNTPVQHHLQDDTDRPAADFLAEIVTQELKKLGLKFIGPTTIYSFLQAAGLVNDHLMTCFMYKQLQ